ncbi:hypothetical protein SPF06_07855 [Sinomonas sp. JGH33]|uniref:HTH cro/C1-type domain-containing protein n=1 Tax=Sinomonas terricola TaxID=3110330 RepID=A0ABU5T4P4_9MICC|nr:hypothetical protein [Sinomonas sp. JGH33]MEA5454633.1 hypothetical protein [Sinomonas sp. JGH33]
MSQQDLGALLADVKAARGWSFEAMSRACGGVPTGKRLFQLVNSPLKNFPDPDTIRGLQRATGASTTEIVMAAARSLGLEVADTDPDALHVPGISHAPDPAREALLALGREVAALAEAASSSPVRSARGRRKPTDLPSNWQDLAAYQGPEEHLRREDEWGARGEESQG